MSRFLHDKDILDSIEPFHTLNILEIFAAGLYAIGNRFPLEIGVNNNLKKNPRIMLEYIILYYVRFRICKMPSRSIFIYQVFQHTLQALTRNKYDRNEIIMYLL